MTLIRNRQAACDVQIEQCLANFEVNSEIALLNPGSPRRKPQDNQSAFDLQTYFQRISGIDFTQIDGMGALTVQTILSEVGWMPAASQQSSISPLGSDCVRAVVSQAARLKTLELDGSSIVLRTLSAWRR